MRILGGIGAQVMLPVVGRPPERTALTCGSAQNGHDELRRATRAECAVGKIAVVESGDEEHAQHIERDSRGEGRCAHPDCKNHQASEMQAHEGDYPQPIELILLGRCQLRLVTRVIGEPPEKTATNRGAGSSVRRGELACRHHGGRVPIWRMGSGKTR